MSSMNARVCACGVELSGINRSPKCWNCRARDKEIKHQQELEAARAKREPERLRRMEELRASGHFLLHSCLSTVYDKVHPNCFCRHWVSERVALKKIAEGEAVDFETRTANWFHRDLCVAGKLKRTPRSATIEKAHISRGLADVNKREKTPEQLKAEFDDLQRRILLDRTERAEEERYRWEVWAELSKQFWTELTIFAVSPEQFDADKKESEGCPGIFATVEERSSMGRTIDSFGDDVEEPEIDAETEAEPEDNKTPEEFDDTEETAEENSDESEESTDESELHGIAAVSSEENTDEYERQ